VKRNVFIIIIIINKVLIKVTLNKVIAGALYIVWLKCCECTGLTVNSRMTIETEMSSNTDGNTAASVVF